MDLITQNNLKDFYKSNISIIDHSLDKYITNRSLNTSYNSYLSPQTIGIPILSPQGEAVPLYAFDHSILESAFQFNNDSLTDCDISLLGIIPKSKDSRLAAVQSKEENKIPRIILKLKRSINDTMQKEESSNKKPKN